MAAHSERPRKGSGAGTASSTPGSPTLSSLQKYQLLVGDVDIPIDASDDSLFHSARLQERDAYRAWLISAAAFGICILAQVVLCLGITIGAQLGLSYNQISIMAGANTGVAGTIAILKGLGLPEKKAAERRKMIKIMDLIKFTTRRLRAGMEVNAEKSAENAQKLYEDAEDAIIHEEVGKLGDLAEKGKGFH